MTKGMDRLDTIKNAYKIHHGGFIRLDAKTENKLYYSVTDMESEKDHSVILSLTKHKVINARCDCTLGSMKSKHFPLCSHIMASIMRTVYDFGRPKRIKRIK